MEPTIPSAHKHEQDTNNGQKPRKSRKHNAVTNINSLPFELLDLIFDSLDTLNQSVASKVCLRWQNVFKSRIRIVENRYKRFYFSSEVAPLRIHRLLTLNESWFMDHENPADDNGISSISFTRGSRNSQTWLNFTIKDYKIDRYIARVSSRKKGPWHRPKAWKNEYIDITDHCTLDEPLFSSDTIAAAKKRHEENNCWPYAYADQFMCKPPPKVLTQTSLLGDVIAKESQAMISQAKGRPGLQATVNGYTLYNRSKMEKCGCRLKLSFVISSDRYLNMTLRDFFQDIWEQTKVWMLVNRKDNMWYEKWPAKKQVLEISGFPEIKSASVELTYGWDEDMVVVLRGVREGKLTYKDGCSKCHESQHVSPYIRPRLEHRELGLRSRVMDNDAIDMSMSESDTAMADVSDNAISEHDGSILDPSPTALSLQALRLFSLEPAALDLQLSE
ncbi:hypothetical protein TWF281_003148 [Arthrobotrys megalospora]